MIYNYISLYGNQHNDNNFVDLGLPSGTLWCKFNFGAEMESSPIDNQREKFYGVLEDWETANKLCNLPTVEQYEELFNNTKHQYILIKHNVFLKLIGENGKYILFPFAGFKETQPMSVYSYEHNPNHRLYSESISFLWTKNEINETRSHVICLNRNNCVNPNSLTFSKKEFCKSFRAVK